jgi:RHS repeat-associated protein
LGNVRLSYGDKNNDGVVNNTEIVEENNYYPFGMLVPNRHGSSNQYRYGFQGQEKDDELKGEGNSLNYTFRMHDPRVGRFFAVDPLASKYPYLSPYQFSSNTPIMAVELEGLETGYTIWLKKFFEAYGRAAIKNSENEQLKAGLVSSAIVKLGFKHYLPKKLIDHYTESNGKTLFLTNKETLDSHIIAVSITKGHNSEAKVRKQEETNFMNEFNDLNPGESKNISLKVSAKAATHGTLGHCTAIFNGSLTKDKDGKNWTFNGTMQFYDYWNFDEKKVGERTKQGEAATSIGRGMLIGEGFKIYSPTYKVSESSKDGEVNWFKDKDSSDLNTKTKIGQSIINTTKDE